MLDECANFSGFQPKRTSRIFGSPVASRGLQGREKITKVSYFCYPIGIYML